jgi:dsRNA-specific ribonuclease
VNRPDGAIATLVQEQSSRCGKGISLRQGQASARALVDDASGRDGAKNLLNEVVHVMRWPFPRYSVTHEGEGTARTKKAAEQELARALLAELERRALLATPVTESEPRLVP